MALMFLLAETPIMLSAGTIMKKIPHTGEQIVFD